MKLPRSMGMVVTVMRPGSMEESRAGRTKEGMSHSGQTVAEVARAKPYVKSRSNDAPFLETTRTSCGPVTSTVVPSLKSERQPSLHEDEWPWRFLS